LGTMRSRARRPVVVHYPARPDGDLEYHRARAGRSSACRRSA
jgi:hypothetical protein